MERLWYKIDEFSLKMMRLRLCSQVTPADQIHSMGAGVSKNDDFCIKNEEFCITTEELCFKKRGILH